MAPVGRPLRINHPTRLNGTPMTVGEAVITLLAAGHTLPNACDLAGVAVSVVRNWLRTGKTALDRRAAGAKTRDLTENQRLCAQFTVDARRAALQMEHRALAKLNEVGEGGIAQVTLTEESEITYDADGKAHERVVARKRTVTRSQPNVRALTWLLERGYSERWGPTVHVTQSMEGDLEGGNDPEAEVTRALADVVRREREALAMLPEGVAPPEVVEAHVIEDTHPPTTNGDDDGG